MAFRRGLWDSEPTISTRAEEAAVDYVLELSDGSLVWCIEGNQVDRWVISDDDGSLRHVCTYSNQISNLRSVVQRDDDTIITGGDELVLWNITTRNCLESLPVHSRIEYMVKTKDQSKIVTGLCDGTIEMRKTIDLGLILWSVKMHSDYVYCICELHDGSFVTTAYENHFKRWSEEGGKVL